MTKAEEIVTKLGGIVNDPGKSVASRWRRLQAELAGAELTVLDGVEIVLSGMDTIDLYKCEDCSYIMVGMAFDKAVVLTTVILDVIRVSCEVVGQSMEGWKQADMLLHVFKESWAASRKKFNDALFYNLINLMPYHDRSKGVSNTVNRFSDGSSILSKFNGEQVALMWREAMIADSGYLGLGLCIVKEWIAVRDRGATLVEQWAVLEQHLKVQRHRDRLAKKYKGDQ